MDSTRSRTTILITHDPPSSIHLQAGKRLPPPLGAGATRTRVQARAGGAHPRS